MSNLMDEKIEIGNKIETSFDKFLNERNEKYKELDERIQKTPITDFGNRIANVKLQPVITLSLAQDKMTKKDFEEALRTIELEIKDSSNFFRAISKFDYTIFSLLTQEKSDGDQSVLMMDTPKNEVKITNEFMKELQALDDSGTMQIMDKNIFDNQLVMDYLIATKGFCFLSVTQGETEFFSDISVYNSFQLSEKCPKDIKELVLLKEEITPEDITHWVSSLKNVQNNYHLNSIEMGALVANQLASIKSFNLFQVYTEYDILGKVLKIEGLNKEIFDTVFKNNVELIGCMEYAMGCREQTTNPERLKTVRETNLSTVMADKLLENGCLLSAIKCAEQISQMFSTYRFKRANYNLQDFEIVKYLNKVDSIENLVGKDERFFIVAIAAKTGYKFSGIGKETKKQYEKIKEIFEKVNGQKISEMDFRVPGKWPKEPLYQESGDNGPIVSIAKDLVDQITNELWVNIIDDDLLKAGETLSEKLYPLWFTDEQLSDYISSCPLNSGAEEAMWAVTKLSLDSVDKNFYEAGVQLYPDMIIDRYLEAGGDMEKISVIEKILKEQNV